jgi:HAMP domain-containing protein
MVDVALFYLLLFVLVVLVAFTGWVAWTWIGRAIQHVRRNRRFLADVRREFGGDR